MKKLYIMLTALMAAVTFASCSIDNDPFLTASEDDAPRILNTDLTESSGGAPISLPKISRDANFKLEIIVTPAEYTTVTWFIDDELVYTGKTIDMPVLAGEHNVKIVATTTKGKSTYRNCTLKVLPLDGDPTLSDDAVARHMMPGKEKTMDGKNLDGVVKVYIKGIECTGVSLNGNKLTFNVPELEEGEYPIVVEKEDGMKYGCGLVIVSNEEFKPAEKETVLWEGEHLVTWGTPFNQLKEKSIEMAKAGKIKAGLRIRAYLEAVDGGGQAAWTSSWWNNLVTGLDGEANRGDIVFEGSKVIDWDVTDVSAPKIISEEGMFLVGNNYKVYKVCIVETVTETVLWEGEHNVTWDTPFDALKTTAKDLFEQGVLAEGKTVVATVSGNGQAALTSAWWNNIMTGLDGEANRGDIAVNGDMVLEWVLTDKSGPKVAAEDGMLIVGNGYTITKVSVK